MRTRFIKTIISVVAFAMIVTASFPRITMAQNIPSTQSQSAQSDSTQEQVSAQAQTSAQGISYAYLSQHTVLQGAQQQVAIGLSQEDSVYFARLVVTNQTTGSQESFYSTASTGSSLLFNAVYSNAGTYMLEQLDYAIQDEADLSHTITFSDVDQSARSFEVVHTVGASTVSTMGTTDDAAAQSTTQSTHSLLASSANNSTDNADASSAVAQSFQVISIQEDNTLSIAQDSTQSLASLVAASITPGQSQSRQSSSLAAASFSAAATNTNPTSANPLIIAIDPGHGGSDSGAVGVNGALEKDLTWKISQYLVQYLSEYSNARVVLTRSQNEYVSVKDRVTRAVNAHANVLVSVHLNSFNKVAHGAEVLVPSTQSYNNYVYSWGQTLGNKILSELQSLRITNRGLKEQILNNSSYNYADGSSGDYFGIIRFARQNGILGIITESAFIDNSSDYYTYLNTDDKLANIARAQANGIASAYGLTKGSTSPSGGVTMYRLYNPNSGEHFYTLDVSERLHLMGLGWNDEGIGWYAPQAGSDVYRLYNPNAGEHHYTLNAAERDTLVRAGWIYEGVSFKSASSSAGIPVYRQYNPNAFANNHNYTASSSEANYLISIGWHDEKIGWYALNAS